MEIITPWFKFHTSLFQIVYLAENKSALFKVMACHQTGDVPLPEPLMTKVFL